jgi:hypothetical protein
MAAEISIIQSWFTQSAARVATINWKWLFNWMPASAEESLFRRNCADYNGLLGHEG